MKFTYAPESRPLEGFTIKRAIYRGGFGEVYQAVSDAGREVALKLLQNNVEIELRGIQQCLNLSHPNLVTIFDIKQDEEDDHWIVMEFVGGETLDVALRRFATGMPMEEVRRWLRGICAGVEYLHSRGLVHRDLKPGNVFSDNGVVKIGDVGLSKFITPSRHSAHTQAVGTIYYMAPEVGDGQYGKGVDVYACGIIVYEMLTGRVPFDGESTREILMKHLTSAPDVSMLPDRIRGVVAKSLAKDPKHRFSSVSDLLKAFEAAVVGKQTMTPGLNEPLATMVGIAPVGTRTCPPMSLSDADFEPEILGIYNVEDDELLQRCNSENLQSALDQWKALAYVTYVRKLTAAERNADRDEARETNKWWIVAGIAALLWFVSRGSMGTMVGLITGGGMAFGFAYGAYAVFDALAGGDSKKVANKKSLNRPKRMSRDLPPRRVPVAASAPPPLKRTPTGATASSPAVARAASRRLPPPTADAERSIASRDRLARWTGSAALMAVLVPLLSAAAIVIKPELFLVSTNMLGSGPDPAAIAHFVLTAIVGTWAISFTSNWWEGRPVDQTTRRVTMGVTGAAVGAIAWQLGNVLLFEAPNNFIGRSPDAAFVKIGKHPLALESGEPTLVGYMVFFATLFAVRRWWLQTSDYREKRLRLRSVLLTMLLAWAATVIWQFPREWGVLWATVMSLGVQLSSTWTPPDQRVG